ncbi:SMS2 protein, partial [Aegithalos caudatus]|nr:SMS2 protein [Aegithalos caudatus]
MQLVASLVSVLLLAWSVRGTALPGEERLQSTRERSTLRKDSILKMLAGLLDAGREETFPGVPEEEEGRLQEERAVARPAPLSQRDRKAPCKNFFWKTFTSC